jgi:hypothetical protein
MNVDHSLRADLPHPGAGRLLLDAARHAERPMQSFVVIRSSDHWTIEAQGKPWGRFAYRVDAEEAALRLADQARASGAPVQVLVRCITGEVFALKVA